ncbi:extracellular solute-binding protein [Streptomyces sp. NBC_00247]|uniref:ABC transporter substrate-binding protein n=1 Tax=Streptomyces sp. NBC_00247 TaxID=2975689 RepID=UPI002E2D9F19|nr:extracellular solute-binding protein [Streptomyces sp. NBC_00247]
MTSWRSARGLREAGVSVVALGLLATGCGGDGGAGAGGKVEIRYSWWGGQERATLINKTIALFEKKYPDIEVKTDFQDYENFWKKFNTQASAGNAPDVFQNSVAFLRKYDDKRVLLDLHAQVEAGNLSMEHFRAGLEKAGEIDGKLVGVPVGGNTFALIYNPAEYKKIGVTPAEGWTWDEYEAATEKISKGGLPGDSGGGGIMYLYDLVLRQHDKAFFTEDAKLGFTESDLRDWWNKNYARTKAGVLTDPKKIEQAKPTSGLSKDLSAGEFTWDNFLVRYTSETKTPLAIAPVPTTDGKRTGQYISSLMLSGSARTKHPKEVATFIDFMVHDPEVGKIMGYDRGVLATEEQFDAYEPTGVSAQIAAYEKQIADNVEPITPHPAGADIVEAAFLRIGADVFLGTTSVDDGTKQFFSEAKTALGS